MFEKDLRRTGIEDRYYPVGSAANHSLLYIILRFMIERRGIDVLDVGSGMTSLLLSDLAAKISDTRVTTLEHDPDYAALISPQISHELVRAPLVPTVIDGRTVQFYDLAPLKSLRFDLIIVDGPPGTRRWSRFGAVHLFNRYLKDEFLFVLDDADRKGELDTILTLLKHARNKTRIAGYRIISALKSQFLIFTERYRSANFY